MPVSCPRRTLFMKMRKTQQWSVNQKSRGRKKRHRTIDFKIWDTAGQEKYHSLAPMYYRGAAAAILVYDICNASSFVNLKKWVDELSVNGPQGLTLIVCGNKYDMRESRKIETESAREYAESVGAVYVETSARDDTNIEQIFLEIGKRVAPAEDVLDSGGGGRLENPIDLAATLSKQPKNWFESVCLWRY